jgi:hypothetical protein
LQVCKNYFLVESDFNFDLILCILILGLMIRQSESGDQKGSRLSLPAAQNSIIDPLEDSQKTDGGEDISELIDIDPLDLLSRV